MLVSKSRGLPARKQQPLQGECMVQSDADMPCCMCTNKCQVCGITAAHCVQLFHPAPPALRTQVTTAGLDTLVRTWTDWAETLYKEAASPPHNRSVGLNSTMFQDLWTVAEYDMEGGFELLNEIYLENVKGMYR